MASGLQPKARSGRLGRWMNALPWSFLFVALQCLGGLLLSVAAQGMDMKSALVLSVVFGRWNHPVSPAHLLPVPTWSLIIFTVSALGGKGLPWCRSSVLYILPLLQILEAAKGWSWAFDPVAYHFHLGFTCLITASVFAAIYMHATYIWDDSWWSLQHVDSKDPLMSVDWNAVLANTALSSKTASEHAVWKTWALSSFGQGPVSESDVTQGDDADVVPVVPTVSHWSSLYSQAHSRGLFDKNMASFGADRASPSGTTHSAATPHREPVISHAPSPSAPEAAAPALGGPAATPKTTSLANPISRTAPATPGMTPTTAKTTTPKTITPKTTTPKTAANTSTGVAISAEAHGTPSEDTLQAAGGASMSVPPPGTGTPIVPTKTELLPGTVSTTILTSATTGPSVVPSACTAHSAVAGAAIGDGAGGRTKPVKSVVYTNTPKLVPGASSPAAILPTKSSSVEDVRLTQSTFAEDTKLTKSTFAEDTKLIMSTSVEDTTPATPASKAAAKPAKAAHGFHTRLADKAAVEPTTVVAIEASGRTAGQSPAEVGIRSPEQPGEYIPAVRTASKSAGSSAKQSATSEAAGKQPLASNTEATAAKKTAKIKRQGSTGMTPLQRAKSELKDVRKRFNTRNIRRSRQNRNPQDQMPADVRGGTDMVVEQANKTTLKDKIRRTLSPRRG
ncbi:hypothetical protein WJX82_011672 [Trebouxia sp. C0006]